MFKSIYQFSESFQLSTSEFWTFKTRNMVVLCSRDLVIKQAQEIQ